MYPPRSLEAPRLWLKMDEHARWVSILTRVMVGLIIPAALCERTTSDFVTLKSRSGKLGPGAKTNE